jgi:DnaK suppressor protein
MAMKAKKRPATKARKAGASKPAKTASVGITKKELGPIRNKLLSLREDLLHKVQTKRVIDTSADVGDEADVASQSIEKELIFELSDNERQMLDQTEAALRKLTNGTYGLCESCRQPIGLERIRALPFARYCIDCQSKTEAIPR